MVVSERPRWQPTSLGTLDRVLVLEEEPSRLFPGDDAYYSERQLERRLRLWRSLEPVLGRILGEGEVVLCAVPAVRKPAIGTRAAFGFLFHGFFRAALVLTDRRLVEVLLDARGRRPQGRVWSLPWSQADTVVMSGSSLAYRPVTGERHRWWLPGRGDRALVRELVPRIDDQLVPGEVPAPRPVPVRHCPGCGAAAVREAGACGACGAGLTTATTAGWLGLAFPGLGLWYAGQRLLGLVALVLEGGLAAFAASRLLLAESLTVGLRAAAPALLLLLAAHLEGALLARAIAGRTRTIASPGRWRLAGGLGALVTVGLLAGSVLLYGGLANRVDRTPDFSANQIGWTGGFEPGEWGLEDVPGAEADGVRSVWRRGDGPVLVVRSTTLPYDVAFSDHTRAWATTRLGLASAPPSEIVAGLECVRSSRIEGNREVVEWLVFDHGYRDVHVLTVVASPGTRSDVERDLAGLLRSISWRSAD